MEWLVGVKGVFVNCFLFFPPFSALSRSEGFISCKWKTKKNNWFMVDIGNDE
jgi:hypothetical protein